jgi:outer membrane lipoprotein SlyB
MLRSAIIVVFVGALVVLPLAEAQRSGQSASISIGVVKKADDIDLRSQNAPAGALVGGMLAYHTTGDKRSSTTKWGRAAAGAAAGAAIARAREGNLKGKVYTVDVGNGRLVQVVSDQTQIKLGDCVTIEEVNGEANIRRADRAACEPEAAAVVSSADVQQEFQEEASECFAAKGELLAAETPEQFDMAKRKMDIFCND